MMALISCNPALPAVCKRTQESVHGNPELEGSHVLNMSGGANLALHMEKHSLQVVQGRMSYNPSPKYKQESTSTSVLSKIVMSTTQRLTRTKLW